MVEDDGLPGPRHVRLQPRRPKGVAVVGREVHDPVAGPELEHPTRFEVHLMHIDRTGFLVPDLNDPIAIVDVDVDLQARRVVDLADVPALVVVRIPRHGLLALARHRVGAARDPQSRQVLEPRLHGPVVGQDAIVPEIVVEGRRRSRVVGRGGVGRHDGADSAIRVVDMPAGLRDRRCGGDRFDDRLNLAVRMIRIVRRPRLRVRFRFELVMGVVAPDSTAIDRRAGVREHGIGPTDRHQRVQRIVAVAGPVPIRVVDRGKPGGGGRSGGVKVLRRGARLVSDGVFGDRDVETVIV